MIDLVQGKDPFVAFVGAGASALPPSNLPTWAQFNNLVLECLCERLAEYSENRQPTEQMLSVFRERRDETHFFAPDFQAQLMEEEVGADYFRVWQSLETDLYGPVHAGLAELASRGRLGAIITTNFDRLIETALRERGLAFEVFHDQGTFEALATITEGGHTSALPVIKLHGSMEDASSLVDTLSQRLAGRPKSLEKSLQVLLRRHPWLYLGFSGADFSYDPHYLGILDAAAAAKGFVFLAREGMSIQEGVRILAEAYGTEKAVIVSGDLSTWLAGTFGLATPNLASNIVNGEDDSVLRVKNRIRQWVESLGFMAVVNIVYAMLKSSGMETEALWLMRKTWKSYRTPDETQGRSYARYNYNYGMSLLETGFIRNPIALDEDMKNFMEWKEAADWNAYEYLGRSYSSGKLLAAGAQLACMLAYRGEVGKAIGLAAAVTDEALTRNATLELCDVAIASAVVYDVEQKFGPPVAQFKDCLRIAKELGDEPRRAMLCALLGRFLTSGGHFDEADEFLAEADRVARRLDLRSVLLASQAARGLWLADSGTSAENAVKTLREVADTIHALDDEPLFTKFDLGQPESAPVVVKGRHPILCRVLLDLNRAALFAGDGQVMNQTLDELDELTVEAFPGYCAHYYLAYAQCLLTHGAGDQRARIVDLISSARRVGELDGNPFVAQAADYLERQIGREP